MAEPRTQSQIDLNRKLTLEFQLQSTLQRFNTKVVNAFIVQFEQSASIIDITQYKNLEPILQRHYTRVGKVFKDDLRAQLTAETFLTYAEKQTVDRTLEYYYALQTPQQSSAIMATTQKNITKSVKKAYREYPMANYKQIANIAGAFLGRYLAGRTGGVAAYETQWAAEFAKFVEANVILGIDNVLEMKALYGKIKFWDSMGDSRVRTGTFNHLRADGLAVRANDPFLVSGEHLMFPGDTSLGASHGNVAGCRCSAYYDMIEINKIRKGMVDREHISALPGDPCNIVKACIIKTPGPKTSLMPKMGDGVKASGPKSGIITWNNQTVKQRLATVEGVASDLEAMYKKYSLSGSKILGPGASTKMRKAVKELRAQKATLAGGEKFEVFDAVSKAIKDGEFGKTALVTGGDKITAPFLLNKNAPGGIAKELFDINKKVAKKTAHSEVQLAKLQKKKTFEATVSSGAETTAVASKEVTAQVAKINDQIFKIEAKIEEWKGKLAIFPKGGAKAIDAKKRILNFQKKLADKRLALKVAKQDKSKVSQIIASNPKPQAAPKPTPKVAIVKPTVKSVDAKVAKMDKMTAFGNELGKAKAQLDNAIGNVSKIASPGQHLIDAVEASRVHYNDLLLKSKTVFENNAALRKQMNMAKNATYQKLVKPDFAKVFGTTNPVKPFVHPGAAKTTVKKVGHPGFAKPGKPAKPTKLTGVDKLEADHQLVVARSKEIDGLMNEATFDGDKVKWAKLNEEAKKLNVIKSKTTDALISAGHSDAQVFKLSQAAKKDFKKIILKNDSKGAIKIKKGELDDLNINELQVIKDQKADELSGLTDLVEQIDEETGLHPILGDEVDIFEVEDYLGELEDEVIIIGKKIESFGANKKLSDIELENFSEIHKVNAAGKPFLKSLQKVKDKEFDQLTNVSVTNAVRGKSVTVNPFTDVIPLRKIQGNDIVIIQKQIAKLFKESKASGLTRVAKNNIQNNIKLLETKLSKKLAMSNWSKIDHTPKFNQIAVELNDTERGLLNNMERSVNISRATTKAEKEAISYYGGSGYSDINFALRKQIDDSGMEDYIQTMEKVIDSGIHKTVADGFYYRGIRSKSVNSALRKLEPGDKLKNVQFESVSVSRGTAQNFTGVKDTEVIFKVNVPKNTNTICVDCSRSGSMHEGELILDHRSEYVLRSVKLKNNGAVEAIVDYVPNVQVKNAASFEVKIQTDGPLAAIISAQARSRFAIDEGAFYHSLVISGHQEAADAMMDALYEEGKLNV